MGNYYRTDATASPLSLLLARFLGDRFASVDSQRGDDGVGMSVKMEGYRWRGAIYVTSMTMERFTKQGTREGGAP